MLLLKVAGKSIWVVAVLVLMVAIVMVFAYHAWKVNREG